MIIDNGNPPPTGYKYYAYVAGGNPESKHVYAFTINIATGALTSVAGYSRNTNPTVQAFETKIRLLEGAAAATTSHVECSAEEREAMGIPEGLVRYSVGVEDVEALIADLSRALESA